MQHTYLLYLEDFTLLSASATILHLAHENEKDVVILDKTVFYPQGGGQPYDKGIIEGPSGKFLVEEVRFLDGIVKHMGKFEQAAFSVNDLVNCFVDKGRRELHSKLHSGGHIVDMAIDALGFGWIPGKGYHFPDGPYVEYSGNFEAEDKEKIKNMIEQRCNELVAESCKTKLLFMNKEDMGQVCRFVPDYLPVDKPARVVMYGNFGVPCGGTHVSDLQDIKHITIRKLSSKGPTIRVSYDVER